MVPPTGWLPTHGTLIGVIMVKTNYNSSYKPNCSWHLGEMLNIWETNVGAGVKFEQQRIKWLETTSVLAPGTQLTIVSGVSKGLLYNGVLPELLDMAYSFCLKFRTYLSGVWMCNSNALNLLWLLLRVMVYCGSSRISCSVTGHQ